MNCLTSNLSNETLHQIHGKYPLQNDGKGGAEETRHQVRKR